MSSLDAVVQLSVPFSIHCISLGHKPPGKPRFFWPRLHIKLTHHANENVQDEDLKPSDLSYDWWLHDYLYSYRINVHIIF